MGMADKNSIENPCRTEVVVRRCRFWTSQPVQISWNVRICRSVGSREQPRVFEWNFHGEVVPNEKHSICMVNEERSL